MGVKRVVEKKGRCVFATLGEGDVLAGLWTRYRLVYSRGSWGGRSVIVWELRHRGRPLTLVTKKWPELAFDRRTDVRLIDKRRPLQARRSGPDRWRIPLSVSASTSFGSASIDLVLSVNLAERTLKLRETSAWVDIDR